MKYPLSLKKQAAQLYEERNFRGKRVRTIKKLASELGVDVQTATYLEYQGRKLIGTLPKPKHYVTSGVRKKRKGAHYDTSRTAPTEMTVSNFVEENIYPAKHETQTRSSTGEKFYYIAMTLAVCGVLGTILINWLVKTLV